MVCGLAVAADGPGPRSWRCNPGTPSSIPLALAAMILAIAYDIPTWRMMVTFGLCRC